jgi:hypothetical protein
MRRSRHCVHITNGITCSNRWLEWKLARLNIVDYHDTVWSEVFSGNCHTVQCLEPAVLAAVSALGLSLEQRKRTVWRLDGGATSTL